MASENTTIEPVQRSEKRSSPSAFQGEELPRLLCCPVLPVQQLQVAESRRRTQQLSGLVDNDQDRSFQNQVAGIRRNMYTDAVVQRDSVEMQNGNLNRSSLDEGDKYDEDDVDQEDERVDIGESSIKKFKSSGDPFNPDQIDKESLKHATPGVSLNMSHHQGKDYQFHDVLPISAISGDDHCVRIVNVSEPPDPQRTEMLTTDSGPASTLWKGNEPPPYESVRSILSDPFTGELMDDAIIFPCGHSFGAGGLHHSLRKKACYTCSLPITEESVRRNLILRAAVAALRREEYDERSLKNRRDMFQEKADFSDSSNHVDSPRSRGLKFPFAVADRVMIVGNKRTPQHFVGREAIITSRCLNGWYVVKTLDNGKSVTLQYRSLAKVP